MDLDLTKRCLKPCATFICQNTDWDMHEHIAFRSHAGIYITEYRTSNCGVCVSDCLFGTIC